MDRFIAEMTAVEDVDLMLCQQYGVAWQKDRDHVVCYDAEYYDKCKSYEGQEIARKINEGRMALVQKYVGVGRIVDVGIGSGEFIKTRPNTYGHDVNPVAIEWLRRNDLWAGNLSEFAGATFFDVIEHCETPEVYFKQIQLHAYLFASIPVFKTLYDIRQSKHYRPGEHLYYFEDDGFVNWMALHGFSLLESDNFETRAGRESIKTYAFKRNRWPRALG